MNKAKARYYYDILEGMAYYKPKLFYKKMWFAKKRNLNGLVENNIKES